MAAKVKRNKMALIGVAGALALLAALVAPALLASASPNAAAATCTTEPACTPSTETKPARRPWATLRVTTYSTAGPGTTSSARLAAAKTIRTEGDGMGRA